MNLPLYPSAYKSVVQQKIYEICNIILSYNKIVSAENGCYIRTYTVTRLIVMLY